MIHACSKGIYEFILLQEYLFTDTILRIGERFSLLGNCPVEKAAARQWVQYRITRLGPISDKRELEETLQVNTIVLLSLLPWQYRN